MCRARQSLRRPFVRRSTMSCDSTDRFDGSSALQHREEAQERPDVRASGTLSQYWWNAYGLVRSAVSHTDAPSALLPIFFDRPHACDERSGDTVCRRVACPSTAMDQIRYRPTMFPYWSEPASLDGTADRSDAECRKSYACNSM